MSRALQFLASVVAGAVTQRLTGSRTWAFVVIVACYLPMLYEAHTRKATDQ